MTLGELRYSIRGDNILGSAVLALCLVLGARGLAAVGEISGSGKKQDRTQGAVLPLHWSELIRYPGNQTHHRGSNIFTNLHWGAIAWKGPAPLQRKTQVISDVGGFAAERAMWILNGRIDSDS